MAKNIYVGVGSKARKIKQLYVGVGGKARKVKKVYVGVGGKARLVYAYYDCEKIRWENTNTVDSSFSFEWKKHGKKEFYIFPVECTVSPTIELKYYYGYSEWKNIIEDSSSWEWTFTRQADSTYRNRDNGYKTEKCQVWLLDIYNYPTYTGETVYMKVTCGNTSTLNFPANGSGMYDLPYIRFKDKDAD